MILVLMENIEEKSVAGWCGSTDGCTDVLRRASVRWAQLVCMTPTFRTSHSGGQRRQSGRRYWCRWTASTIAAPSSSANATLTSAAAASKASGTGDTWCTAASGLRGKGLFTLWRTGLWDKLDHLTSLGTLTVDWCAPLLYHESERWRAFDWFECRLLFLKYILSNY